MKEGRQLCLSGFNELRERFVVQPEDDGEHWPRGEREDAQRNEIDHQLLRRDAANAPGGYPFLDLPAQLVYHRRYHPSRVRANRPAEELGSSFRMVVELTDEVGGEKRVGREIRDIEANDAVALLFEGEVGSESLDQGGKHPAGNELENRGREAFLGAEVVVEECLVDVRFARDFLHAGAGCSMPHEDGASGFQYPALCLAVRHDGRFPA